VRLCACELQLTGRGVAGCKSLNHVPRHLNLIASQRQSSHVRFLIRPDVILRTIGEFHNRSQLSTDGPLPRSPAPSLSTEITTTTDSRERSHSMLSTSTPPTDTDPELAARMDEIYADGWVRKITNDSIECFLCGRWYRVGQQYRNMHIWRAHRKKCSQRALAFRGLRKSNTPVTYAAHRCEIDPDDEFALEWIDHPQVHDLDKTYVHCNQCNTKIQRKQWPTHVRAACVGVRLFVLAVNTFPLTLL